MAKVTFAQLHSGLFIPNAGGNGKSLHTKETLPPESSFLKNLQMTEESDGGILLEWECGTKILRYKVGQGNVKGCMYEAREKTHEYIEQVYTSKSVEGSKGKFGNEIKK
jgi:hypothetical protein